MVGPRPEESEERESERQMDSMWLPDSFSWRGSVECVT